MNKSSHGKGARVVMRIVTGFIAGAVLVGCSADGRDEPAGTTISVDSGHAVPESTAKSDTSSVTRVSGSLPAGYPVEIAPVYEPSTVTYAGKMGSGKMLKYMVVAETDDRVETVAESLVDGYKARGAQVSRSAMNEDGVGQVVASQDGYGIIMTYSAGNQPGTTRINYDVHPQRERR